MVHGNITCSTVLLNNDGQVKIGLQEVLYGFVERRQDGSPGRAGCRRYQDTIVGKAKQVQRPHRGERSTSVVLDGQ